MKLRTEIGSEFASINAETEEELYRFNAKK